MIEALPQLKTLLLTLALATPRIIAAFTVLPFLTRQVLPGLARNAVALSLSLVFAPLLYKTVEAGGLTTVDYALIVLKETLIGFLMGYLVGLVFWGIEAVGALLDNQRGASIASTLNPLSGSESSPLSILLFQTFVAYFFAGGGFMLFLDGLYNSYLLWPITSLLPSLNADAGLIFLNQLDRFMGMAVLLAAPAIVAMFLAEFGLAMVSRFAPQLQVFFLAMPIKSGVAMFVLILYMAFLFRYLHFGRAEINSLFDLVRRALP
jgi:type III secretion protein T